MDVLDEQLKLLVDFRRDKPRGSAAIYSVKSPYCKAVIRPLVDKNCITSYEYKGRIRPVELTEKGEHLYYSLRDNFERVLSSFKNAFSRLPVWHDDDPLV